MAGSTHTIDGVISGKLSTLDAVTGELSTVETVSGSLSTPRYATDYNDLDGKPSINYVTVQGDKLGADYHLQDKMGILSQAEIEKILYLG